MSACYQHPGGQPPEAMPLRPIPALVAVVALLGLSGCLSADKPLLTDDNSVTPYTTITFVEQGSDDTPDVMTRQGKAYINHAKDGDRVLRFMAVKDNWYVAEMSGADEDASVQRLYALVRIDLDKKVAETFASMGDEKDVGPGLRVRSGHLYRRSRRVRYPRSSTRGRRREAGHGVRHHGGIGCAALRQARHPPPWAPSSGTAGRSAR